MPNYTARNSARFSMASHVASYPSDKCAFDASLALGSVRKREAQKGGANDQCFHGDFLVVPGSIQNAKGLFLTALRPSDIFLVVSIIAQRSRLYALTVLNRRKAEYWASQDEVKSRVAKES